MAEEVVPPAVGLATERAGVGPNAFVGFGDVPLQAVKFGEGLAARRPVLHNPETDLLLFRGNVLAFLLWYFGRGRGLITWREKMKNNINRCIRKKCEEKNVESKLWFNKFSF